MCYINKQLCVPVKSICSLFKYWPLSACLKVWPLTRPWVRSFLKGSLENRKFLTSKLHLSVHHEQIKVTSSTCEPPGLGPGRNGRGNGHNTSAWRRAPSHRCTHPQAASGQLNDVQKACTGNKGNIQRLGTMELWNSLKLKSENKSNISKSDAKS